MAAKISFTATASLNTIGITPESGPGSTLSNLQSFNGGAVDADDQHSRSFIVNASTTDAPVNLGPITTGTVIMIEVSGTVTIKLTQNFGAGPIENSILVKKMLMLVSDFTVLKVSNAGGTAVDMMVSLAGNRPTVGGGPGIF